MKTLYKILAVTTIILTLGVTIASCSSTKNVYTDTTGAEIASTEAEFKMEKSGAQHWGEACNRCHIAPSPASYNDTDWDTISLHMRVRANLTEKEINKITEFLKSAN